MANRVYPAPIDADNSSGSLPAACSDWRFGDADSMSARNIDDPTTDAGYTTAGASLKPSIGQSLAVAGESIYEWLDCARALAQAGCAVNLTPNAFATFITVSNRGFAPGASAL